MITENNFPCGEPHQMLIVNCSTVVSVFQCKYFPGQIKYVPSAEQQIK